MRIDLEEGREFQDFIDSISLSREELELFVAVPELSMQDVRLLCAPSPAFGPVQQARTASVGAR